MRGERTLRIPGHPRSAGGTAKEHDLSMNRASNVSFDEALLISGCSPGFSPFLSK